MLERKPAPGRKQVHVMRIVTQALGHDPLSFTHVAGDQRQADSEAAHPRPQRRLSLELLGRYLSLGQSLSLDKEFTIAPPTRAIGRLLLDQAAPMVLALASPANLRRPTPDYFAPRSWKRHEPRWRGTRSQGGWPIGSRRSPPPLASVLLRGTGRHPGNAAPHRRGSAGVRSGTPVPPAFARPGLDLGSRVAHRFCERAIHGCPNWPGTAPGKPRPGRTHRCSGRSCPGRTA